MTIDLFPVIFFSSLIALLNPKSTIAFRNVGGHVFLLLIHGIFQGFCICL